MASASRIKLDDQALDCEFHPSEPVLVVGLITGDVQTIRIAPEVPQDDGEEPAECPVVPASSGYYSAELLMKSKAHKGSCRAVQFSEDGTKLFSASSDGSIRVTNSETGKKVTSIAGAHDEEIYRLETLGRDTVASGDDSGCIKVWDARQRHLCGKFSSHEDYITDLLLDCHQRQCLIATSGDATVSLNDLRKFKVAAESESGGRHELLSVCSVMGGKSLVCGTQTDLLLIFSRPNIAWHTGKVKGHPDSVDALMKIDEDTMVTGCGDGAIRLVNASSRKICGTLGRHGSEPVERLCMSSDGLVLGSIGHDSAVCLWDMSSTAQSSASSGEMDEGSDDSEEEKVEQPQAKKRKIPVMSTFFADLNDDASGI